MTPEQALDALGDSAELVALNLYGLGIRAVPRGEEVWQSARCPIAQYLNWAVPGERPWYAGVYRAEVRNPADFVRFSPAVASFVQQFDEGKWPELERG